MKRKLFALFMALTLAVSTAVVAFADQPPGQLGYEGVPGNQGQQNGN